MTTQQRSAFARVPGRAVDGTVGPDFWLGVFPVTVGEYSRWPGAVAGGSAQHDLPVTDVTWGEAAAYCSWLGGLLEVECRLPTASEWEHAAGGGRGLRWSLGDTFDRAVYAPDADRPRPVGVTPPNPFGLRDLTGNVFEWCADELTLAGPDGPVPGLGSRLIKGGAYTVRNPGSFENACTFSADEQTSVPYIGFRVLAEQRPAD